ncbi:type II secretion system F family protein [Prosthecomicrobium sp. N25]|uniref:type II secretion system F family protein n=1 Tax=Prosthecomicrobium sp. N25 TaxID=3129254 RepID=UPI0030770380
MFGVDPVYLFYAFGIATAIIMADLVYQLLIRNSARRAGINRRLRRLEAGEDREQVLIDLRKRRGLGGQGETYLRGGALDRLVTQSGLMIGLPRLLLIIGAGGAAIGLVVWVLQADLLLAAGTGIAVSVSLPWLVLSFMRSRRQEAFAAQFPDALDIVVRSLRAGHPVSIAFGLVAREMPDPIGTEFGLVVDEVTYGLPLETALANLKFRVGHQDLALFVTSVSVQSSTGGNLSEVLEKLSRIIRDRFKLKRKVRSLSAEGRFSAIALSMAPWIIAGVIHLVAPTFFGEVWGHPLIIPIFVAAFLWSLIGDFVMYRMVNFKF